MGVGLAGPLDGEPQQRVIRETPDPFRFFSIRSQLRPSSWSRCPWHFSCRVSYARNSSVAHSFRKAMNSRSRPGVATQ